MRAQNEAEEQRAIYSVLQQTVSPEAWTLIGSLSLAQDRESFTKMVDTLDGLNKHEVGEDEQPQMVGVLRFLRGYKMRVSRYLDGSFRYEVIE